MERVREDVFYSYHPLVNFFYFALVLLCSMLFMHPVSLVISLCCAFIYSIWQKGRKALKFNFLFLLPMLLVTALINPAFNHAGVTILTYLPSGNPLTLESILYGIAAAALLVAVICWFSCYNEVVTTDKFVYLFGRIIPALSLIFSMALRFVPRFKAQIKTITAAQRCIGRDPSTGTLWQRARQGMTILSIMVTWALENAIDTADSMKSRGYGLAGRSAFSIYRLDRRDKTALAVIAGLGAYILIGAALGRFRFQYFPGISGAEVDLYGVTVFLAYAALCLVPVYLNGREARRWKALRSNI